MGIPISEPSLIQPGIESVFILNIYWIGFIAIVLFFAAVIHLFEWILKDE